MGSRDQAPEFGRLRRRCQSPRRWRRLPRWPEQALTVLRSEAVSAADRHRWFFRVTLCSPLTQMGRIEQISVAMVESGAHSMGRAPDGTGRRPENGSAREAAASDGNEQQSARQRRLARGRASCVGEQLPEHCGPQQPVGGGRWAPRRDQPTASIPSCLGEDHDPDKGHDVRIVSGHSNQPGDRLPACVVDQQERGSGIREKHRAAAELLIRTGFNTELLPLDQFRSAGYARVFASTRLFPQLRCRIPLEPQAGGRRRGEYASQCHGDHELTATALTGDLTANERSCSSPPPTTPQHDSGTSFQAPGRSPIGSETITLASSVTS